MVSVYLLHVLLLQVIFTITPNQLVMPDTVCRLQHTPLL